MTYRDYDDASYLAPVPVALDIIDVWEAGVERDGGEHSHYIGVYRTAAEALAAGIGPGGRDYPPQPRARKAVRLADGKVWLLDQSGPGLMTKDAQAARASALAKLTLAEREILGIK
jgi:hypothetical protein